MDEERKAALVKRRAEQKKYQQMQRRIRIGAIILALILSFASLMQSCSTRRAVKALTEASSVQQQETSPDVSGDLFGGSEAESGGETAASVPTSATVTLSVTGNIELASDSNADYTSSIASYYDAYGTAYFFQNVKSYLLDDTVTLGNLTCCLTDSDTEDYTRSPTYRADPSYAACLKSGGIDVVDTSNAHTYDYGTEGFIDTLAYLDNAGVERFGAEQPALLTVSNITIGFSGVDASTAGLDCKDTMLSNIKTLQNRGAQLIVASFNWGDSSAVAADVQKELARAAVDAGADLVVGQSASLSGIERYQGSYIIYSLGNFCYGGDSYVSDMDTAIAQITFTLDSGKKQDSGALTLIPCSMSSDSSLNNYCPTPASGADADAIMDSIYELCRTYEYGINPDDIGVGTSDLAADAG